jgi:general secretion pathway protein G
MQPGRSLARAGAAFRSYDSLTRRPCAQVLPSQSVIPRNPCANWARNLPVHEEKTDWHASCLLAELMNTYPNPVSKPTAVVSPRKNLGATLACIGLFITIIFFMLLPSERSAPPESPIVRAGTEIATLSAALRAFSDDNGYYPRGSGGLAWLVQRPPGAAHWHGPYLADVTKVPLDPWRHEYLYECPGSHNPRTFDLSSMGPDGIANTEDDICNWRHR